MTDRMPRAEDAYERFRRAVKQRAAELKKPLEVSQAALWAERDALEAALRERLGEGSRTESK